MAKSIINIFNHLAVFIPVYGFICLSAATQIFEIGFLQSSYLFDSFLNEGEIQSGKGTKNNDISRQLKQFCDNSPEI
jgi:hypothetical protein